MSEQNPRRHSEVPGPAQAEAEQIHSESALDFQWDTALVTQLLLAHPFLPAQHPPPLGWASFSQAGLSWAELWLPALPKWWPSASTAAGDICAATGCSGGLEAANVALLAMQGSSYLPPGPGWSWGAGQWLGAQHYTHLRAREENGGDDQAF